MTSDGTNLEQNTQAETDAPPPPPPPPAGDAAEQEETRRREEEVERLAENARQEKRKKDAEAADRLLQKQTAWTRKLTGKAMTDGMETLRKNQEKRQRSKEVIARTVAGKRDEIRALKRIKTIPNHKAGKQDTAGLFEPFPKAGFKVREGDRDRAEDGLEALCAVRSAYILEGLGDLSLEGLRARAMAAMPNRVSQLEAAEDKRALFEELRACDPDDLLKISPYSDKQISEDVYEPLRREKMIPEKFIPPRFSLVQQQIDGAMKHYTDRLKEVQDKDHVVQDKIGAALSRAANVSTGAMMAVWGISQASAGLAAILEEGSVMADTASSDLVQNSALGETAQFAYVATYFPYAIDQGYQRLQKAHFSLSLGELGAAVYAGLRIAMPDGDDFNQVIFIHRAFLTAAASAEVVEEITKCCTQADYPPGRAFEAVGRVLFSLLYGLDKARDPDDPDAYRHAGMEALGEPFNKEEIDARKEKDETPPLALPSATRVLAESLEATMRMIGAAADAGYKRWKNPNTENVDNQANFMRAAGKMGAAALRTVLRETLGSQLGRHQDRQVPDAEATDELNFLQDQLVEFTSLEEGTAGREEAIEALQNEIAIRTGEPPASDAEEIARLKDQIAEFYNQVHTDAPYDAVSTLYDNVAGLVTKEGKTSDELKKLRNKRVELGKLREEIDPEALKLFEEKARETQAQSQQAELDTFSEQTQFLMVTGLSQPVDAESKAQYDAAEQAHSLTLLTQQAAANELWCERFFAVMKIGGAAATLSAPAGLAPTAAANMAVEARKAYRFYMELKKWDTVQKDIRGNTSIAREAIGNRYKYAAESQLDHTIKMLLYGIELLGEGVSLASGGMDGAAGLVVSGTSRAVSALLDVMKEAQQEEDMRAAWAVFEKARRDPHNRALAREAIHKNPTLAKYAMAYGALVCGDPAMKRGLEACNITEAVLANPSTSVKLVQTYLELLYQEDPVLERAPYYYFGDNNWCPERPGLSADSWARIIEAATDATNYEKFTNAGSGSVATRKQAMAARSPLYDAVQGGLAKYGLCQLRLDKLDGARRDMAEFLESASMIRDDLIRALRAYRAEPTPERLEVVRTRYGTYGRQLGIYESDYAKVTAPMDLGLRGLREARDALERAPCKTVGGHLCEPLEPIIEEYRRLVAKAEQDLMDGYPEKSAPLGPELEVQLERVLREPERAEA